MFAIFNLIVYIMLDVFAVSAMLLDDNLDGFLVKKTHCTCEPSAVENDIEDHAVYCNRFYRCQPVLGSPKLHKQEYQCPDNLIFNPASALDKTQPACMLGSCDGTTAPPTDPLVETEEPHRIYEAWRPQCNPGQVYAEVSPYNCLWFQKCVDRPGYPNPSRLQWIDIMECPVGSGFNTDAVKDPNLPPCIEGHCLPGEFNCSAVPAHLYTHWQNPHNCQEHYSCTQEVINGQIVWTATLHSCGGPDWWFHANNQKCYKYFHKGEKCPQLRKHAWRKDRNYLY